MSGPKCFEVRETTLNNARRGNRADCEATLAEYRRLFRQYSELTDRARSVEVAAPSPATDPARLAKRVATVFANSRDDGLAVVHELYREKQLLESHLSQLAAAVQEQVATLQRRLRELRREVGKLREDRLQFERNLENAVPPNWPQTEAARIRTQGLAALHQITIPDAIESAENPVEIAALRRAAAAAAQARSALDATARQFAQDVRDTHARLVTAKLAVGRSPTETLAEFLAKQAPATAPKSPAPAADTYAEKADHLLAELSLLQDHASWSSLRNRASAIDRAADPAARRTQYEALLLDCSVLLKQTRAHSEWRARLEALLDRTSAVSAPAITLFREQLQNILRAGAVTDTSALEQELAVAVATENKRRQAEERRQAVLDSLAAIGYEIDGAPLETAVVRAGKVMIRKPGSEEYAVEMVVNPDLSLLQTALVRFADTADLSEQQRLRDIEHEESWCGDHARLREELARRGFDAAFKLKLPSGQHPVRVVVREAGEQARRTAASSPAKIQKRQNPG